MRAILQQPYPLVDHPRKQFLVNVGFVVFTLLFLWIFRPFGLDFFETTQHTRLTLGAAFWTLVTVQLNLSGLRYLFQHHWDERNWRLICAVNFTLWNLGSVIISLLAYAHFTDVLPIHQWREILLRILQLLGIALIPIIFFMVTLYATHLYDNMHKAAQLNAQLDERNRDLLVYEPSNPHEPTLEPIQFRNDSQRERALINPNQLVYAEAANNYVALIVLAPDLTLSRKIIRSTMKRVEEDVRPFPEFIRCHRTFIVNSRYIRHISGNAQGYRLTLLHTA